MDQQIPEKKQRSNLNLRIFLIPNPQWPFKICRYFQFKGAQKCIEFA